MNLPPGLKPCSGDIDFGLFVIKNQTDIHHNNQPDLVAKHVTSAGVPDVKFIFLLQTCHPYGIPHDYLHVDYKHFIPDGVFHPIDKFDLFGNIHGIIPLLYLKRID